MKTTKIRSRLRIELVSNRVVQKWHCFFLEVCGDRGKGMNRIGYFHILTLITLVLLIPVSAEAQTGSSSVALKASVSEVVTLSVAPNSLAGAVAVVSTGDTVRLTLSGASAGTAVIRVPLFVRSNTSFRISGNFESTTAQLTQLSVSDVRATGTLVSPEAVNSVEIPKQFDLLSPPFLVVSGPRVTLGGTLNSPNNALEVTLVIRVKPESVGSWQASLTFFNH